MKVHKACKKLKTCKLRKKKKTLRKQRHGGT